MRIVEVRLDIRFSPVIGFCKHIKNENIQAMEILHLQWPFKAVRVGVSQLVPQQSRFEDGPFTCDRRPRFLYTFQV